MIIKNKRKKEKGDKKMKKKCQLRKWDPVNAVDRPATGRGKIGGGFLFLFISNRNKKNGNGK
jgi:hypothetical protein